MTEKAFNSIDPSQRTLELISLQIDSLKELLQSRIQANEKAVDVAHDDLVRVPTEVQKSVGTLRDLHETKICDLEKLLNVYVTNITYISELKSKHQSELDLKESTRIDAIRKIDQLNRTMEAERSATAVSALATANTTTAETLRTTVANSANTLAGQFEKTVSGIVERLANLEKSSYLGAGKAGVADPQIERLSALVEKLAANQAQGTGKSEGIDKFIGWIVALAAIAFAYLKK